MIPLLIERVLDAGLAPVFVVDELDKVDGERSTFAERLREAVRHLRKLVAESPLGVTISAGLATFPHDATTSDALVGEADDALYERLPVPAVASPSVLLSAHETCCQDTSVTTPSPRFPPRLNLSGTGSFAFARSRVCPKHPCPRMPRT